MIKTVWVICIKNESGDLTPCMVYTDQEMAKAYFASFPQETPATITESKVFEWDGF